jgi:hypothetical protein
LGCGCGSGRCCCYWNGGRRFVGIVPVDLGRVLALVEINFRLGTDSHACASLYHKSLVLGRASNITVGHGLPEEWRLGILGVVGIQGLASFECTLGDTGTIWFERESRVDGSNSGRGAWTRRRSTVLVGIVPGLFSRILSTIEIKFRHRARTHASSSVNHKLLSVG